MFIEDYSLGLYFIEPQDLTKWYGSFWKPSALDGASIIGLTYQSMSIIHFTIMDLEEDAVIGWFHMHAEPKELVVENQYVEKSINTTDVRSFFVQHGPEILRTSDNMIMHRTANELEQFSQLIDFID